MPVVKRRRPADDRDDPRDEDERPRRSRDEEDDEDERPRRSSRRDERDDEEDERPRRARRDRDDEDEDDRPRSRRRERDDEEDEDERPRSRRRERDDDDDDERPARRSRRDRDDDEEDDEDAKTRSTIRAGWDGFRDQKSKFSDFPENLKITGDPELLKFLEDGPFANFHQHWIDAPPNGIKKKSWTCIEVDCPLCGLGDRPRLLTLFNVLHISTGGDPVNKVLELGVKAAGQLLNFGEDEKTGPLSKLYYAVSKSGKGQQTAYNFRPVKDRDLEEDWDIDPISKADIADAKEQMYDKSVVQRPSRAQLKELAKGLSDDD